MGRGESVVRSIEPDRGECGRSARPSPVETFFESVIWHCTTLRLALGVRVALTWGSLTTTQLLVGKKR